MAVDIIASLGVFKSMLDIAKTLKDMNDATARNGAVIELQEKILAAREAQSALLDQVSQLEKEMIRFETWGAEKQRYQLEDLPPGVIVRTLKPEMANGEPAHHICATCYEKGIKSPLHRTETIGGIYHLKCGSCGADLRVGHSAHNNPPPRSSGGGRHSWMR